MNRKWFEKKKEAEKHSVDRESINHTDKSVGRSQPEALIIHTYTSTQEQGWQFCTHDHNKTTNTTMREPFLVTSAPAPLTYTHTLMMRARPGR